MRVVDQGANGLVRAPSIPDLDGAITTARADGEGLVGTEIYGVDDVIVRVLDHSGYADRRGEGEKGREGEREGGGGKRGREGKADRTGRGWHVRGRNRSK